MANATTGKTGKGVPDPREASPAPGRVSADLASCRAWGLYGQGNLEEALRTVRAGLELFPDSLDLRYVEGLIFKRLGRQQEAASAFREALLRVDRVEDKTRAAMLRRLLVGHVNLLEQGGWNLEPETWVRV